MGRLYCLLRLAQPPARTELPGLAPRLRADRNVLLRTTYRRIFMRDGTPYAREFELWSLLAVVGCTLLMVGCSRDMTERTSSLSELRSVQLLELPASAFEVDVAAFTGSEWALWRNAALVETVTAPIGVRGVALEARGSSCSGSWPLAELFVQGRKLGSITVSSPRWTWYVLPVEPIAGSVELKIAFVNDRFSETEDMNLFIRNVMLVGDSIEK